MSFDLCTRAVRRSALSLLAGTAMLFTGAAAHAQANCPGQGSCFVPNGTPGCNNAACCQAVCAQDPFCCATEWDQLCVNQANQLCVGCAPACGKANVECLSGPQYANSRFVAQLRDSPGSPGFCTAWIVAAPDIMLTNAHCSPQVGDVVAFNFECNACTNGTVKPTVTFTVTQILACNGNQDWCIFRVNGNVAAQFGQATIDPSVVSVGQPIYEIHHAEGQVKGFDDGTVTGTFLNVSCPGNIQEHSVSVIASQGASGSPVFRTDNNCVTAVCNCGPPCSPGFVLPMSTIWPNLSNAITNAGGTFLLCGQAACPPSDHNCFTTGGPGCTDTACCSLVCAQDPFCCDTSWDGICVNQANELCAGCGNANAGDCCEANGTPYCSNRACCDAVCAFDPFCCTNQWDGICVEGAQTVAACGCDPPPFECPDSNHNCFTTGGPGCTDDACCEVVCAQDPFCCETAWDTACVNQANDLCTGCGNASSGDCCEANGTPFCDNRTCCDAVCAVDPFCCATEWDSLCVEGAQEFPSACGCPPPPFECPDSNHNCFTTGGPGCTDDACCELVCAQDPFCCATSWDGACVNQANDLCTGCGNATAGDCCAANGTPFCDNRTCCDAVCAFDPFCCDVQWDGLCADGAATVAACNCALPCLGDLNGDGIVDASDLGVLLLNWGPCAGCPADLNGDGIVDAADLGILLLNWGQCP